MKNRSLLSALALLGAVGCANDVEGGDQLGGGSGGTFVAGGSGGEVATGGGGEGGGKGGGTPSLCEDDCSTIEPPDCYVAVCNEGQYAGQVGACTVVPANTGTPCDDGLFCTVDDYCDEGTCQGGLPNNCGTVAPACEEVVCNEGSQSCSTVPSMDGAPCIPSDLCEVNATCNNGVCSGNPKDCTFSPLSECNSVSCNPATGACEANGPANDGGPCSLTGDLCQVGKTCDGGNCVGGSPKDCTVLNIGCDSGVCDAQTGNCMSVMGMPGDTCLDAADECNTGLCDANTTCQPVPTPGISCPSAVDECNTGTCDNSGLCQPVPTPGVSCASQVDECNTGTCDNGGACQAVPTPGVMCPSQTDQCNVGSCDASGNCVGAPVTDGTGCSDGNSCTINDQCTAGMCVGTPDPGYTVYFTETFASNAAGWTLGQDWEIGPAMASTGSFYNDDPAMDHTPTADNGVAGVVIGGLAPTNLHGYYWLESPIIDTSAVPGSVWLEFYRWLNSDYTPYMQNRIEVYNGSTWVLVWESGPSPGIQDNSWTKIEHDLTAYKNANMRVRFGFQIGSSGVFNISSWNIDDVTIASAPCN